MARPRLVSDEAILNATRDCVSEHGTSVSTTVIAEAVGVSQATLFKRFGTKEDLIVAALLPSPDMAIGWMNRFEQGPEPGDLQPQFKELVFSLVHFFEHMLPRLAMLKSACLMEQAMKRMAAFGEDAPPIRGRRVVAGWLRRAQEGGQLGACEPNIAAVAIIGAAQGMASRRHMLNEQLDASVDEYASQLADLIWAGLAPKEGA